MENMLKENLGSPKPVIGISGKLGSG